MSGAALGPLFDLLDRAHDAVDGGWVTLAAARWHPQEGEHAPGTSGVLTLTFRVLADGELADTVDVVATGIVEHRIVDTNGGGIALIQDPEHPLLRRHTDPRQTLYLRALVEGAPSIGAVLGAVWAAHDRVVDDWIDPRTYLNREMPLAEVLDSFGMFARGPRFLIAVYREVLVAHGYDTSTIDDGPAGAWQGGRWQPRTTPVLALHFGDSFVVAERFEALLRPTAH